MDNKELHQILNDQVSMTLKVLSAFNDDYVAKSSKDDVSKRKFDFFWFEKGKKLKEKENYSQVNRIINKLPKGTFNNFLTSGIILSNSIFQIHNENPDWTKKYSYQEEKHFENLSQDLIAGFIGLKKGFNPFQPKLPLNDLITTIFGPDAINVLTMDSVDGGQGKIQPHECSRENWIKLLNISTQAKIESELLFFESINPALTKLAVFALWNMFAILSYIDPAIFITESDPHLSSSRSKGITISQGGTHTIIEFYPKSFITALNILNEMMNNPICQACDMMWVACGLIKSYDISRGYNSLPISEQNNLKLFLSHRGTDSKKLLMSKMLDKKLNKSHIFLDCLSLPKGLINRNFVFKNLTSSKKIAVVKTENFYDSIWCKKEEVISLLLEKYDSRKVQFFDTVEKAMEELDNYEQLNNDKLEPEQELNKEYVPWTTVRVIRDSENELLGPNLKTLEKSGFQTVIFEPLIVWLKGGYADYKECEVEDIAYNLILKLLKDINIENYINGEEESVEPLIVACQLTMGALCIGSFDYEKMNTRSYISSLNSVISKIIKLLQNTNRNDVQSIKYILLTVCAFALQLSPNSFKTIRHNGIEKLVRDYAILKDGLILLDFRINSDIDPIMINIVSQMVRHYEIGTIGIVQSANSTIHEKVFDGHSLEILPCVTFHKGMEELFEKNET